MKFKCLTILFFAFLAFTPGFVRGQTSEPTKQTLVFLRHGEKPLDEIGQLNCQGLSRSLKIPSILLDKFGKPNFIFAPNPMRLISNKNGGQFYYTRPLITIEPLAIRLNMPVDLSIGFNEVEKAVGEWTNSKYSNSLLFITWEHKMEEKIVRAIYTLGEGNDGSLIPKWHGDDYDSLYVLSIYRNAEQKITQIQFSRDEEGLNGLSEECPS